MGAVPGGCVLTAPRDGDRGAFDVEPFRRAGRRVVIREIAAPIVVFGSTQSGVVVDADRAARRGVGSARRRSGGGLVLLLPGAQVWADLWVPRDDPLWSPEPCQSAVVAGEWWAEAIRSTAGVRREGGAGRLELTVHRGRSVPAAGSDLVCFAGIGPGEVTWNGRKVVGLAQWRSREGALVHGCAYRRWDPGLLVDLLAVGDTEKEELAVSLRDAGAGFEELGCAETWGAPSLLAALPEPASWEVLRAG